MLAIGLTGGIGSGKTTVADLFAKLGVEIIDTDQLAREVVLPNTPALQEIVNHFGKDILDSSKQLDRAKLRERIFNQPEERRWLEQLLHPLIREKVKQRVATVKSPYCIVVIPLLVETLPNPLINRILVIDVDPKQQIARAQARDKMSREQIEAILKAQVSREKRMAAADDLIHNDRDLNFLQQQVAKLHEFYLNLAGENAYSK